RLNRPGRAAASIRIGSTRSSVGPRTTRMESWRVDDCFGFAASVTFTLKDLIPVDAVAEPVMVPSEFSVSPAGRDPLTSSKSYGGWPPVAAMVATYADLCG